ncbi:MAG: acyl-CoA dehydratase activase [Deltaproteobacteria bacterium]|jgi:predicted CoA-substrate-specific enzyme activase|nr:acyl-CoA dehydratase activase [Deltaproteobacteria bacterium]
MTGKANAIGIDCGSSYCKGALYSEGRIVAMTVCPTGWDISSTGSKVKAELMGAQPNLPSDVPVVATGYGREKISGSHKITEITCHAKGAEFLFPGVSFVIDIGGQDSKVIKVEKGKVSAFLMNDKCAAGSGRFLEMVLDRMDLDLEGMEELLAMNQAISLNGTCAVFAESEIIGLLAQGVPREQIIGGVAQTMAAKIASQAARIGLSSPIVLTGGLAQSGGLRLALSDSLGQTVESAPKGIYAGAIGAALLAREI